MSNLELVGRGSPAGARPREEVNLRLDPVALGKSPSLRGIQSLFCKMQLDGVCVVRIKMGEHLKTS